MSRCGARGFQLLQLLLKLRIDRFVFVELLARRAQRCTLDRRGQVGIDLKCRLLLAEAFAATAATTLSACLVLALLKDTGLELGHATRHALKTGQVHMTCSENTHTRN